MNMYYRIETDENRPYPYNVQILTGTDRKTYYSGAGRYCKTIEEADAYIKQHNLIPAENFCAD